MNLYSFILHGYEGIEYQCTLSHENNYTEVEFLNIIQKAIRKVTRKRENSIINHADNIIKKLEDEYNFTIPNKITFGVMEDATIKEVLKLVQ